MKLRRLREQGIESPTAKRATESPAVERTTDGGSLRAGELPAGLKRVKANKGKPGNRWHDGRASCRHLKQHWPASRQQLLNGTYQAAAGEAGGNPQAGRRRAALGIPTVLDRFIQQAVLQVLQRRWDPTFSEHSYGFRPGARRIRRWPRRKATLPKATAGWWTSIWRSSSIGSTTTADGGGGATGAATSGCSS